MKNAVGRNYAQGKSDAELIGHIGFGHTVEVNKGAEKNVLITGAGSYIGESFIGYAAENYTSIKIDAIDMIDGSWKEKDFSNYDIVYHVAGIAHADVGNVDDAVKEKYYAVNTDLAIEVCKKAKAEGVKEFIFMSSMIVYGDSAPYGKEKIVNKNTVPKAANFYGDSKLQADVAVRSLADDNFKVIVLRPPMIYGKGSKGNYPTLAKLAKKLSVFPDVNNQRSMLHIDNLCEFLCQIMLVKEVKENAIVLIPQNAEWTKTADMVKEIAKVSGKKIRTLKFMKSAVLLGGKMPGKIGGLVNKAFGNSCYAHEISIYEGLNYQKVKLIESIIKTEKEDVELNEVGVLNGLVSIITPAYNCEATIKETIESVIAQTYTNWEMIIVNDCSTDHTADVINKYKDERIKLINLEKNSGTAIARNTAIGAARGRYIALLDSDDLWKPQKLEKQIKFMENNKYAFSFTAYDVFINPNDKVRRLFEVPFSIKYKEYLSNTIIGCLTVVVDRSQIPDFHMEKGYLEDILTWMYYLRRGIIAYGLNENLASYRIVPGSKSSNKIENSKRYFQCLRIQPGLSFFECIIHELGYALNALKKRILGKKINI